MVEPPDPWTPLKLPEIEPQPKEVVLDQFFRIGPALNERELADFDRIRLRIEQGRSLDRYYRRSRGYDTLLRQRGILHLHLGHAGSDALLYLMQYPRHVLFLCVDTHVHLEDVPVGKRFRLTGIQRFQRVLRQLTQPT